MPRRKDGPHKKEEQSDLIESRVSVAVSTALVTATVSEGCSAVFAGRCPSGPQFDAVGGTGGGTVLTNSCTRAAARRDGSQP